MSDFFFYYFLYIFKSGALVDAAVKMGFEFRGKSKKSYLLKFPPVVSKTFASKTSGKDHHRKGSSVVLPPSSSSSSNEYTHIEVLVVLEFNSDRKRNSVIVRLPNGNIKMYSKGADATMLPLLHPNTDKEFIKTTLAHMKDFAAEGLRTLVVAQRDVTEKEYETWRPKYDAALNEMGDRQAKIDEAAAEMEHDRQLIGATAIEDKLQEGVPDCIEMLRKAGMKIWVLTGDKQETAINIAFACKLLTPQMQMVIVNGNENEKIKKHISLLSHAFANVRPTDFMKYGLVIEGSALSYCLSDDLISETLSVCLKCGVVVCCRVSPKQKGIICCVILSLFPSYIDILLLKLMLLERFVTTRLPQHFPLGTGLMMCLFKLFLYLLFFFFFLHIILSVFFC
jgi:magnesium-transporting ATPase (P-type)